MIPKYFKMSSLLSSFITNTEIHSESALDHLHHPLRSMSCLLLSPLGWTNATLQPLSRTVAVSSCVARTA